VGTRLVNAACYLDNQQSSSSGTSAVPEGVSASKALLDHILLLTGGQNRAAKDKTVRAQGCALVAALVAAVPEHKATAGKLVEFALDRVPSIREKAVRGLAAISRSEATDQALAVRASDPCTAVRASAVRGLCASKTTAPALLERIDDVEPCVRVQLFQGLAEQPAAVDQFGPAALVRLLAGLADRSSSVRGAAGRAVDVWHKHLGGALPLLARCDVMDDEQLGEAAAAALAQRFPAESEEVIRKWLSHSGKKKADKRAAPDGAMDGPAPALFTRVAVATMSEDKRDEVVDVPALLRRTSDALEAALRPDSSGRWQDYLLRQLLHIIASLDMCDESVRREVDSLAEKVLLRAPLTVGGKAPTICGSRPVYGAADLSVVILRKCCGLAQGFVQHSAKYQALETRCSMRVILLVSELCQPFEGGDAFEDTDHWTTRLSLKLQDINAKIAEREQLRKQHNAQKKKAIADEDFLKAQKIKEDAKRNDKELATLQNERGQLTVDRDTICLRVLAIITALLRWTNSEMHKDAALWGTLEQILVPIVRLPALSDEVELAAISAISLFCTRDGPTAKNHWSLFMAMLRELRVPKSKRQAPAQRDHMQTRAGVAACALADCARIHGGLGVGGYLNRDEILGAASALAAVPFWARRVALEPLCGWLLSFGHVFFEEHLREPVLEIQWALGWMVVEAFKQRRRLGDGVYLDDSDDGAPTVAERDRQRNAGAIVAATNAAAKRGQSWVTPKPNDGNAKAEVEVEADGEMEEDEDTDSAEALAMAARLTKFFSLLPNLPGKHGAPLLSLAVESVAESGLWRRAALLPRTVGGQTRWLRGFSWPQLFAFVHRRLNPEMRFRIWRSSLQVAVAEPQMALLAEVPHSLEAAAGEAPPGAAALLREAIGLGADKVVFAKLLRTLPVPDEAEEVGSVLLPREEALALEQARREALAELGVDVGAWAPAGVEAPHELPPHLRMKANKGKAKSDEYTIVPPVPAWAPLADDAPPATPQQQSAGAKRRRQVKGAAKEDAEEAEQPLGRSKVQRISRAPANAGG
jgi:hypothetical protein